MSGKGGGKNQTCLPVAKQDIFSRRENHKNTFLIPTGGLGERMGGGGKREKPWGGGGGGGGVGGSVNEKEIGEVFSRKKAKRTGQQKIR